MSSSASLLLLALALARAPGGSARAGATGPLPTTTAESSVARGTASGTARGTLAQRVAESVGELWQVPLANLRVSWGLAPAVQTLDPDTPFRLLGRGADGWFAVVFVPANRPEIGARLRAGVVMEVPVAARSVRAGSRLVEDDVRLEQRVRWGAPVRGNEAIVGPGWLVRRSLDAGAPLAPPSVSPPPMVDIGHSVRAVYSTGSVQVSIEGVALNAAALGEPVRIRTTGRIGLVRGIVTGPGEARVTQ
jgi:flagella basal body P-ring formation protein FlgA